MEVELGLKITHTRDDDIISHSDLRINKNYVGPLFLSRETDTVFFLIAYLKGFKRENIRININEDGNHIAISGTRAVQEMVLSGSSLILHRKDVELRAFKKVFQIPDGVILDKIKAKFNDHESTLIVTMPKSFKGMRGLQIQELKDDDSKETDEIEEAVEKEFERSEGESKETGQQHNMELQNEEPNKPEPYQESTENEVTTMKEGSDGEDKRLLEEQELIEVERQKNLRKTKGPKLCPPFVVAGSAILVSLVVLVISFIRAKRK